MIPYTDSLEKELTAPAPAETRTGAVSFFDYTPKTAFPPFGMERYGFIVSQAVIRSRENGATCGLLLLVSRRDLDTGRVTLPEAIECANRARTGILARMLAEPAWNMTAVHKWDGAFLGWQRRLG